MAYIRGFQTVGRNSIVGHDKIFGGSRIYIPYTIHLLSIILDFKMINEQN